MATRTVSAATAAQPRAHIGVNTVTLGPYTQDVSSLTASAGDIILFRDQGKIPHGAVITHAELRGDTTDGGWIYQLGWSGNAAALGSATMSNAPTVKPFLATLPFTVSISDDQPVRYVTLQLSQDGAATSASGSASLMVVVQYNVGYR